MDFKDNLNWFFRIFCIVTIFQVFINIIGNIIALIPCSNVDCEMEIIHKLLQLRWFVWHIQWMTFLLLFSFIAALLSFILTNNKVLLKIPFFIRYSCHFLLFSSAYFLFFLVPLLTPPFEYLAVPIPYLIIIILLTILLYSITIFLINKSQIKLLRKKQEEIEKASLEEYISSIESHFNNFRKLHHDFHNTLISLKLYLQENRLNELKDYFQHQALTSFEEILTPLPKNTVSFDHASLSSIKVNKPWLVFYLFCKGVTFHLLINVIVVKVALTPLGFNFIPGWNTGIVLLFSAVNAFSILLVLGEAKGKYSLFIRHGLRFILAMGIIISTFFYLYHYFYPYRLIPTHLLFTALFYSIGFYVYSIYYLYRSARIREHTLREEANYDYLMRYSKEIQEQYDRIEHTRKELTQILFTINQFIEEEDLMGLQEYYQNVLPFYDDVVKKDSFLFNHLDKIKIPEIKSIFISKLMGAKHLQIDVHFESIWVIDHISIPTLTLAKMLGILLDNAIEALETIEDGQLNIGVIKEKYGVCFIIENTCPASTPPLWQIWKEHFSTKGEGRGLGLSNLLTYVDHLPNVTLETDVIEGKFIQKIVIANH